MKALGLAVAMVVWIFSPTAFATGGKCSFGGVKIADQCQGITFEGCCNGAVLVWCEEDGSALCQWDCSKNVNPSYQVCGWAGEFYDCGGDGEDPSGEFPLKCQCQPKCDGKECGYDGCGGECGSCGEGKTCDLNTNKCVLCSCEGKECGQDGCGKGCGVCGEGKGCSGDYKCVTVLPHCVAKDTPGCPGCACEDCVCKMDKYCCQTAWDSLCVKECVEKCGGEKCDESVCIQSCKDKECGSDGCGGFCGNCAEGMVCNPKGKCCKPSCEGKECGDNGCGGTCGKCGENQYCDATGKCKPCSCEGKECGQDGCGKGCGFPACPEGKACDMDTGKCITPPSHCIPKDTPGCKDCPCEECVCKVDSWCCKDAWDSVCVKECVEECGGEKCPKACYPKCKDKQCGDDGCGGICGTCAQGEECTKDGKCCKPNCTGKECGDNGCGGTCGKCGEGKYCDAQGKCQQCSCNGKECGDDGCGKSCGKCPNGKMCSPEGKCVEIACGVDPNMTCKDRCGEYDPDKKCQCDNACVQFGDCCPDLDACCFQCNPPCKEGEKCIGGKCVVCSCEGKECGKDNCGNSCGECPQGKVCGSDGKCGEPGYPNECLGLKTPSLDHCLEGLTYEGCCDDKGRVVFCNDGKTYCIDCKSATDPEDQTCGWKAGEQANFYDCGGQGEDPSGKNPIKCPFGSCTPKCEGKECGDDGCGGTCGTCPQGKECKDGKCVETCTPKCEGKECGDNGCGGTCGTCPQGKECKDGKCVETCTPKCEGKECGDDGCGGTCGTCKPGEECKDGKCIALPVEPKPDTGKVDAMEEAQVADAGTDAKKPSGGGGGGGCAANTGANPYPFLMMAISCLAFALNRRRDK